MKRFKYFFFVQKVAKDKTITKNSHYTKPIHHAVHVLRLKLKTKMTE